MGEDHIISAKESMYRLVSLEPVSRSTPSKFQTKQVCFQKATSRCNYGCLVGFLRRHYRIGSDSSQRALCSIDSEGPSYCDPLALVEGITPVEDNKGLLVQPISFFQIRNWDMSQKHKLAIPKRI
ncbi:hypothetical protein Tco_0448904 [Tanacetum coccineum]